MRAAASLLFVVGCAGAGAGASACSDASAGAGSGADAGASDVPAPRPVSPVSVSHVTTKRPPLAWALPAGTTGARVELCADRACGRVVASFDAKGTSGAPGADLPAGAVFWRLRGMNGASVGSSTSATWELVVPATSAPTASTWGLEPDGNGDGFGDLVVGDSDAFTATSHAYVHAGSRKGPALAPTSVLSAPAPTVHYAGSIACAGDVDGDGFPELLVGSPGEDGVYVYAGGPGGWAEPPAAMLQGPTGSAFGTSVAGVGDVDGDGYGDVVIGSPNTPMTAASPVQGSATVLLGGAHGLSMGHAAPLGFAGIGNEEGVGNFVAGAGDTNGDGLGDVVVYAGIGSRDPQVLLVYLGQRSGFGAMPSLELQYQAASSNWMGNANLLAGVGDVTGDGYPDVAMASCSPPNAGSEVDHVSLFFGGPGGPALVPSRLVTTDVSAMNHFGTSLAGGDFDGDGATDLAVAILAYGSTSLAAQTYRDASGSPALATSITTSDPTLVFEREVAVLDVDGDGRDDLVVGFPSRQPAVMTADGGGAVGAVEVHRGMPGGVSVAPSFTLPAPDPSNAAYGASLVRR